MSVKTIVAAFAASTAIGSALGAAFALVAAPAYPGTAQRLPASGKALAAMAPAATTILCFTPEGQCEDLILREIGGAQHQILVHAFSFTSTTNIPDALVAAKDRGVDVRAIVDRRTPCGKSAVPALVEAKIPVSVDISPPYAHEKAIIIDGGTVIAGSYNWSREARYNSEDLRLDRDVQQAAQYTRHWQRRLAESVAYKPGMETQWCHHQQAEAP